MQSDEVSSPPPATTPTPPPQPTPPPAPAPAPAPTPAPAAAPASQPAPAVSQYSLTQEQLIRQQLLAKQKQLLELQQKKIELELEQTKAQLVGQKVSDSKSASLFLSVHLLSVLFSEFVENKKMCSAWIYLMLMGRYNCHTKYTWSICPCRAKAQLALFPSSCWSTLTLLRLQPGLNTYFCRSSRCSMISAQWRTTLRTWLYLTFLQLTFSIVLVRPSHIPGYHDYASLYLMSTLHTCTCART